MWYQDTELLGLGVQPGRKGKQREDSEQLGV